MSLKKFTYYKWEGGASATVTQVNNLILPYNTKHALINISQDLCTYFFAKTCVHKYSR